MLRRAASGHIAATQVLKFAAASRIALAVIKGWPEAPSSPLQGGAAPPVAGAVCAGAEVPGGCADGAVGPAFGPEPVKMLSKKFRNPPPEDCARASPASSSAAAMMTAWVRIFADGPVRRAMSLTRASLDIQPSGGLVTVSNSLTRARFCVGNLAFERPGAGASSDRNKHQRRHTQDLLSPPNQDLPPIAYSILRKSGSSDLRKIKTQPGLARVAGGREQTRSCRFTVPLRKFRSRHISLCSRMQTGYQRANLTFRTLS